MHVSYVIPIYEQSNYDAVNIKCVRHRTQRDNCIDRKGQNHVVIMVMEVRKLMIMELYDSISLSSIIRIMELHT